MRQLLTIEKDGQQASVEIWENRPEKEGVYLCVTEEGCEVALELSNFADHPICGIVPRAGCWRLPGFSGYLNYGEGGPCWQPGWLKSVGQYLCGPVQKREWTPGDEANWELLKKASKK